MINAYAEMFKIESYAIIHIQYEDSCAGTKAYMRGEAKLRRPQMKIGPKKNKYTLLRSEFSLSPYSLSL